MTKPITSFYDLVHQHRIQYFPVLGGSAYHYFDRLATVEEIFYEKWKRMSLDDSISEYTRSKYGVWTYPITDKYTKVWQAIMETGAQESVEVAVDLVRFGNRSNPYQKFAYISEQWDLRFLEMKFCELEVIGEPFSSRHYAMAVPKGSPMRQLINDNLYHMEQDRTLEYLWNKWWKQNPYDKKCAKGYRVEDGINFDNMGGLFIILSGGLIVTVISMVVECIIFNFQSPLQTAKLAIMEHERKIRTWLLPRKETIGFSPNDSTSATVWSSFGPNDPVSTRSHQMNMTTSQGMPQPDKPVSFIKQVLQLDADAMKVPVRKQGDFQPNIHA